MAKIKPGQYKVTRDNTKKFNDAINALDLHRVLIGIPEKNNKRKEENEQSTEGKDDGFDGMSNAAIAYIQEFGSERAGIPPRPFLIPGIREAQEELVSEMRFGILKSLKDKGEVNKCLTRCGIIGANWVKSWINSGIGFVQLSEATLKQRQAEGFKGTKPLIRTAQMRNAVTYVLDKE